MHAIHCTNLGKSYRLRSGERYQTLRDSLTGLLRRRPATAEHWALRGVELAIEPGTVVGLIGGNGAGKSTLLKLLARITHPSEGHITLRGRVGSLLEVGTGFHPELSGRENIFLAGAVIGMHRSEIQRCFDAIVAFAEIGPYLDEAVKRYSSGMFTRLAFAVAAHLDSEILLVDEVLAVGDARFQQRCLGRMSELGHQGRTVIFVSHSMAAVRSLCPRSIWLDRGSVCAYGATDAVISDYLRDAETRQSSESLPAQIAALPNDPDLEMLTVKIGQDADAQAHLQSHLPIRISMTYRVKTACSALRIYVDLFSAHEDLIFRSFHDGEADAVPTTAAGTYRSELEIPADFLAPGTYRIAIMATIFNVRYCIAEPGISLRLTVSNTGRMNLAYPEDPIRGLIAPRLPWRTTPC